MKTLITYYSRSGNTKIVADKIAEKLKADVEEIIDTKNRNGILGYIVGDFDAVFKKQTTIKKTKKDPSKYNLIIIGTPVWGGTMTPAVRTYTTKNKNKIKKTSFFCTMGGKDEQKTFTDIKALLGKEPIATIAIKTKEVKKEEYKQKIEDFVKSIK